MNVSSPRLRESAQGSQLGNAVHFSCEPGYHLNGSAVVYCMGDGTLDFYSNCFVFHYISSSVHSCRRFFKVYPFYISQEAQLTKANIFTILTLIQFQCKI